jgi:hypothetical protein
MLVEYCNIILISSLYLNVPLTYNNEFYVYTEGRNRYTKLREMTSLGFGSPATVNDETSTAYFPPILETIRTDSSRGASGRCMRVEYRSNSAIGFSSKTSFATGLVWLIQPQPDSVRLDSKVK